MGRAFEYRKATKFARWDRMAKAFTKAGRDIALAIKGGGANPESNPALRRAIQNAKAVQMPKDRIDAALKRATEKGAAEFIEMVYEGTAPYGVALVVETTTDNLNRTAANVRAVFNKLGGTLGTQGMHNFLFTRKGAFEVLVSEIDKIGAEDFELQMIEEGLESLEKIQVEDKEIYLIYTAFEDFGKMQNALENKKIPVEQSYLTRVADPNQLRNLDETQKEEVLELIDKLEQDDDVSEVYHNLSL